MSIISDLARNTDMGGVQFWDHDTLEYQMNRAVDAVHNSSLGLDGSICKRDVLEWLKTYDPYTMPKPHIMFEREFGLPRRSAVHPDSGITTAG